MKLKHGLVFCCLVVIVSLLTGCWTVATTSADVVYNRKQWENQFQDQYITLQAHRALRIKTKQFDNANLAVSTYNGVILLTGQVPEAWQKPAAQALISKIPHVKKIYNLVTIQSPSSTLTRMSDTWLTGKVKSKLIASEDLDASKIKVVSENGVVYLMGIVPPNDAHLATQIASETDGVLKVVTVFSYLHVTNKPTLS